VAQTHQFPEDRVHFTWDAGNEPVLEIESGDTVVYETREVSDGQITPDSTAEVIAGLDWSRVYPLAGPVRVEARNRATRSRSRSSRWRRAVGATP